MEELRAPIVAAVLMLFFCAGYALMSKGTHSSEGMLTVAFLDVGQGDSIFIESPTGTQILIDGGKGSAVLNALHGVTGFFDRHIDMLLATHPDQDHIGGLIDVLAQYTVDTIVVTESVGDSPASKAFERAVATEGADVIFARRGQVYDLGDGEAGSTTLRILFPDHDPSGLETNTASIVAQLAYGDTEYLLTGDSPSEIEEYLVRLEGENLQSDIVKLGHHGSDTSTSESFLTAADPIMAIISAGRDNEYGHPHQDVLERLERYDIQYKNTADEGSIVFRSDGKEIFLR